MGQGIEEFWTDARNEIVSKCIRLSANDATLGSSEGYQGSRERIFDSLFSALLQDMQDSTLAKTSELIDSLAREAVKYGRDVEPLERIIEILMESAEETVKTKYQEESSKVSRITGHIKEYLNEATIILAKAIIKAQAEVIEKQKE